MNTITRLLLRRLFLFVLSFGICWQSSPRGWAALGDVEVGFNPDASEVVLSAILQPDGKVVMGGFFTSVSGNTRNFVARVNPNGSLDTTFNPNATAKLYCATLLNDGKMIIGGDFSGVGGVTRNQIARLNADGTLDAAYNPNATNWIYSVIIQPDGSAVIGGGFFQVGGVARNGIARLNADGTLDPDLNRNTSNTVNGTALQADGKIVLTGYFTSVGGVVRNRVARLNSDGTLDSGFNPNANNIATCAVTQPDGKIVVGGDFTSMSSFSRNHIARLNADGSLDTAFDPNASGNIQCIVMQTDGKILIGGDFTTVSGVTRTRIARLNPDGSVDTTFNASANDGVRTLAIQADGKIVVGGHFTTVNGTLRNHIARLSNDAATQTLSVLDATTVEWTRSGAAPEVEQVTFDLSTDGGANWIPQGVGTRIAGGWRRTGLALPPSGSIRARGRAAAGIFNGSSSVIEQTAPFTFTSAPIVATGSATGVTTSDAVLGGTANPNGSVTTAFFEYGPTASYGNSTSGELLGDGTSDVPVSAPISGLAPSTIYHFRLVGSNANGTVTGADGTFTTQMQPTGSAPTVVTGAPVPGSIGPNSATIAGTVNPNGLTTTATVEFGLTTSYAFSMPVTPAPGSGNTNVAVSAALNGLTPDTLYHYRVVATNAQGTTNGADATFQTASQQTLDPQPDRYFVGEKDETLPVLENDGLAGLTIVSVTGATIGTVSVNTTTGPPTLLYSPVNTNVPVGDPRDTLSYTVQHPTLGQASADVDVYYFFGLRGPYRGSFIGGIGGGVDFGRVDLDLTRTGEVTGVFQWQGRSYPFKDSVDLRGRLLVQKPKFGGGGLLVLNLVLNPGDREMGGTFTDFTAQPQPLIADMRLIGAPFVPVTNVGKAIYTAFIDPSPVVEDGTAGQFPPEGAGYSVVRTSKNGKLVRFAGRLTDDEPLSRGSDLKVSAGIDQGVASCKFDRIPLYKGRGMLDGEVKIDPRAEAAQNLDAVVTHVRQGGVGTLFPNGFTVASAFQGQIYQGTLSGLPPGYTERTPNARVTLSRGGLDKIYEGFLRIAPLHTTVRTAPVPVGEPAGLPISGLKVRFLPLLPHGTFFGSFTFPDSGTKVKFHGAISGNGGRSRGHFVAEDNTGLIEIEPY